MWYSSQKMTNTRTSSRAASAAACSGDRIGSDTSSPSGGRPSAETNLNDCTVCGAPSSSSEKSSAVRSVSGSPCRSTTVTSTRTRFASVRNVGGCGVWGACAAMHATAATNTARLFRLEGDIAADVDPGGRAVSVRDRDVEAEKRGGEPDPGAVACLQRLIRRGARPCCTTAPRSTNVVTPNLPSLTGEVSGSTSSADIATVVSPTKLPARKPRSVRRPPSCGCRYGGSGRSESSRSTRPASTVWPTSPR